jgi:hypothetical protein
MANMNPPNAHDMYYYDNSSQRSPGSRQPSSQSAQPQRQPSRPFDLYASNMPPPFADDQPPQSYPRGFPDRGNPTPLNTSYMPGYETWSGPFASTPNNPLSAGLGAGNRVSMKTLANRPARIGLPNVRCLFLAGLC